MNHTRYLSDLAPMALALAIVSLACEEPAPNPCLPGTLSDARWSQCIGAWGADVAMAIAVDERGQMLVGGHFSGPLDVGEGAPISFGEPDDYFAIDGFLAAYGTDGARAWVQRFGADGDDRIFDIEIRDDAVYATGYFANEITIGAQSHRAQHDPTAFLARFASDGQPAWSRSWTGHAHARALAVDAEHNVTVAGHFEGEMAFATDSFDHPTGFFAVNVSAAGGENWARAFPYDGVASMQSVASQIDGGVVMVGTFWNALALDGNPRQPVGSSDIFLAALDHRGDIRWIRTIGGPGSDRTPQVSIDRRGDIYVAGTFELSADFEGGARAVSRLEAPVTAFIARYTQSGDVRWVRQLDSPTVLAGAIATGDWSGDTVVAVTGSFKDWLDLDGHRLPANEGIDIFTVGYDSDGERLWLERLGGPADDWGNGIATADGQVWLSGQSSFTDTLLYSDLFLVHW